MKERIYSYDNLKFFLITLVVIGHLVSSCRTLTHFFGSAYYFIFCFHMPAFIFLSGLFSKRAVSSWQNVKSRVIYFLILSFLCDCMAALVRFCWVKKMRYMAFSRSNVSWYLFALAVWYIFTCALKDVNKYLVLCLSVVVGCFVCYDARVSNVLHLSRIFTFYPFFYLGYMLDAGECLKFTKKPAVRVAAVLIIGFLAWACYFRGDWLKEVYRLFSGRATLGKLRYPQYRGLYRLAYYAVLPTIILSLVSLSPDRKLPVTKLGQRTLQVYFLHDIMIIYNMRFADVVLRMRDAIGEGKLWQILYVGLGVVITLFLSMKIFGYPFEALARLTNRKTVPKEKEKDAAG